MLLLSTDSSRTAAVWAGERMALWSNSHTRRLLVECKQAAVSGAAGHVVAAVHASWIACVHQLRTVQLQVRRGGVASSCGMLYSGSWAGLAAPETVGRLPCQIRQAGQLLSKLIGRLYQPVSGLRCSLCRAGRCLQARGLVVKVGICTQNSFTSGEAIRCEQGRPCSHRTARNLLLGTVSLHTGRRTSHAQLQWPQLF